MSKVTISYNIGMTLVFFLYAVFYAPFMPDDETPIMIEGFFEDSPAIAFAIAAIGFTATLVIFMYAIRSLWNRLFPQLCGWKEIGLAESYALGIFVAFLVYM